MLFWNMWVINMEETKKSSRIFGRVMLLLFVMFLCLYAISSTGYLQRLNQNRALFTEEQIKRFEEDVENGNYVDINDYIVPEAVDYSNGSSRLGEKLSNAIDYTSHKSLELFNSFFAFLFK